MEKIDNIYLRLTCSRIRLLVKEHHLYDTKLADEIIETIHDMLKYVDVVDKYVPPKPCRGDCDICYHPNCDERSCPPHTRE